MDNILQAHNSAVYAASDDQIITACLFSMGLNNEVCDRLQTCSSIKETDVDAIFLRSLSDEDISYLLNLDLATDADRKSFSIHVTALKTYLEEFIKNIFRISSKLGRIRINSKKSIFEVPTFHDVHTQARSFEQIRRDNRALFFICFKKNKAAAYHPNTPLVIALIMNQIFKNKTVKSAETSNWVIFNRVSKTDKAPNWIFKKYTSPSFHLRRSFNMVPVPESFQNREKGFHKLYLRPLDLSFPDSERRYNSDQQQRKVQKTNDKTEKKTLWRRYELKTLTINNRERLEKMQKHNPFASDGRSLLNVRRNDFFKTCQKCLCIDVSDRRVTPKDESLVGSSQIQEVPGELIKHCFGFYHMERSEYMVSIDTSDEDYLTDPTESASDDSDREGEESDSDFEDEDTTTSTRRPGQEHMMLFQNATSMKHAIDVGSQDSSSLKNLTYASGTDSGLMATYPDFSSLLFVTAVKSKVVMHWKTDNFFPLYFGILLLVTCGILNEETANFIIDILDTFLRSLIGSHIASTIFTKLRRASTDTMFVSSQSTEEVQSTISELQDFIDNEISQLNARAEQPTAVNRDPDGARIANIYPQDFSSSSGPNQASTDEPKDSQLRWQSVATAIVEEKLQNMQRLNHPINSATNTIRYGMSESDEWGSVLHITNCSHCGQGTSYTAKDFDFSLKWFKCSECKETSTIGGTRGTGRGNADERGNGYTKYNKLGPFLVSLMSQQDAYDEITSNHQARLKLKPQKIDLQNCLSRIDEANQDNSDGKVSFSDHRNGFVSIQSCGYFHNIKTLNVSAKLSQGTIIDGDFPNEKYYEQEDIVIINAVINYDGISISGQQLYPFTLEVTDLNGLSKKEKFTHRILALPSKVCKNSRPLAFDKHLAPLRDEIAILNTRGVLLKSPSGKIIRARLNVINFTADSPAMALLLGTKSSRAVSPCSLCWCLRPDFDRKTGKAVKSNSTIQKEGIGIFGKATPLAQFLENFGVTSGSEGYQTEGFYKQVRKTSSFRAEIFRQVLKATDTKEKEQILKITGYAELSTNSILFTTNPLNSSSAVVDFMHLLWINCAGLLVSLIKEKTDERIYESIRVHKEYKKDIWDLVQKNAQFASQTFGEAVIKKHLDSGGKLKAEQTLKLMILMPIILDEEEKAISDELRSLILRMREIIIRTSGSDLRLTELKEFSSFIESFVTDYEKFTIANNSPRMNIMGIHSLIHIPELLALYGPSISYNAMLTERTMGAYKKSASGRRSLMKSINIKEVTFYNLMKLVLRITESLDPSERNGDTSSSTESQSIRASARESVIAPLRNRLPEFTRFSIEGIKKKMGIDNELTKDEIQQIKCRVQNSERLKNAIEYNQTDDFAPEPISSLDQLPHSIRDEMRRVLLESYPETRSRGCNVQVNWRSEITIDVFGDQRSIDRLSVGSVKKDRIRKLLKDIADKEEVQLEIVAKGNRPLDLDVSVLSNQKERWCHVLAPETTDPTKLCLAQVLAILQVNDIIFVVGIIFPRAEFYSLDLSSHEDASRNDVNSRMLHLPGNTKGRLEILKIDSIISKCSLFATKSKTRYGHYDFFTYSTNSLMSHNRLMDYVRQKLGSRSLH